jgi:hypothetical protein
MTTVTTMTTTNLDTLLASLPRTINDLLSHPAWDGFIHDRLGNDLFLSDPDRAGRIYEAAKDGCDGSTHAEIIEDWRDFAETLFRDVEYSILRDLDLDLREEYMLEGAVTAIRDSLFAEIDACEDWHDKNGTLHEQIG